ncbi:MAG: response regulator transcription factor [Oscillospiraceae bacterium]|nr:response regulator transcription factor [Oscillospiraceae bacterium]
MYERNDMAGFCRPNVIIADSRDNTDSKLSELLLREEINVMNVKSGSKVLASIVPHMMIIRDGGINSPAFDEIERVRSMSDIPILTVSEDCTEIYRIMALTKGADACMSADELSVFEFKARVVSMLRRYLKRDFIYMPPRFSGDTITNGVLTLDRRRRELYSSGVQVRMTSIEYGIMEYLMENCGNVCAINDIYRRVWREKPYSVRKTVVEHIRRIRCKIEPDPHNPSYIKVVFGVGYKMERAG